MKEKEFINIIKNVLNSCYIGDDCAYLRDLGIVISQDSLVEDVHFKKDFCTPFQLGYKSVMVNISDICASGAKPKYLTISLSLPNDIDSDFVKEFYEGAKFACGNDVEIVGGDITSSAKIYISICAIGDSKARNISSRKNAKEGYKVVVSGLHGSSAAGLRLLLEGKTEPQKFIKAHLEPQAQVEFSQQISLQGTRFFASKSSVIKRMESEESEDFEAQNDVVPYAMMDTSDGLMDALSTIANESGVLLEVDFDKIPYDEDLEKFENWQDMVLFGGEDYGLVAVVLQDFDGGVQIGTAKHGLGVDLNVEGKFIHYSKQDVEDKIFNHFN